MKRSSLYRVLVLVLLGSLLGGCLCPAEPSATPVPTAPPYTPPPPDNVAPVVIQRTPEPGEELGTDEPIQLVFDRAMDKGSVEKALLVGPDVSGSVEWVDDRTVNFKPKRELERDTEYLVTLGSEAKAADGNQLDGTYRFRFRTVGFLEVAQVIPAPDTEDVEAASTITVIFNRPVVPLMAVSDPDYAGLPQPLTIDPPVAGQGEWLNTSIYIFTPDGPLAGGTTYAATITAGLEDTTGGVLSEDYEWTFSTQPPQVVWVSPPEDEQLVGVDTAVQVTFNQSIDPASAEAAFHLQAAGGMDVPGSVEVDGPTLTFKPERWLSFDAVYMARVDAGLQSAGGGAGMREDYAWRFTTVPLPRILSTNPYDGQRDAWPHTSFEIVFNAPIDPATVMPNLEMTPPLSPTQVYTYFSRWSNIFVLNFGAQPSTDYEVRIGPDIADPYGNLTDQELTVRFRTAALDPRAEIQIPTQVSTLDANQPARVIVGHLNTDQLDFSLYQLDTDEFLRAQRDWWDYTPSGSPARRWSLSVDAPLNERERALVNLADGGALSPGIYLLDMRAAGVRYDTWSHRKLLVVSAYNLTLKRSWGEMWVWATDLAGGQPAGGLELAVVDDYGTTIASATTDVDGLARFSPDSRSDIYVLAQEPFVLAGTAWDWSTGISPWDFGLESEAAYPHLRAHVYTDRPIYRPGQTVYFRGFVRMEDDVQYSLPEGRRVEVNVYDAMGEEIYNETLTLDEFGAFHGEVALTEGASLGGYHINATLGKDRFAAMFQVAAYRPPEFEVTVTPRETELAPGQTTQADVKVSYYFGGPVADAAVEWRVLSTPYRFEPAQFGRYSFAHDDDPWICRWCWWWEEPAPEFLLGGSGTTNAEGQLTVVLPTEVMTGGQRLTVEATVYGRDGQVISGRGDVVVHAGEFYAGLAPQQYVGEAGEEMAVDVVTVDWAGERLPDQALEFAVYRREWVNTFVENECGDSVSDCGGRWEWETKNIGVYYGTLTTDARAEGVVAFTPEEGGAYVIVVGPASPVAKLMGWDEGISSTWVWVSGREYVSWRRENNDRINLISDKTTYVPGETAEILIPSPFAGEHWVWITVERGGILKQEVLRLESNSTVYRLPITAEHAPNVYVSAVIFKGPDEAPPEEGGEPVATHKVGYVLLTVEPVAQTLDVTLTPSDGQAEPGETVTFDVQARDADGEPVWAAFSLDLVDKAVLSLQPRTPDAINATFYGRRGLGVSTYSGMSISINRLLEKEIEELEEHALGMGGGGDDIPDSGGGGEEGLPPPAAPTPAALKEAPVGERAASDTSVLPPGVELREEFEDTAFWDATVVTGEDGKATVEIALPDNLTTWVLRGVGATADTQVGEETVELLVTKPLLVRPVTPRFFVVDDRAQLAALVSNNTGETQEVEVALHAEGLKLTDPAAQMISISDGGEAKVTWWVEVEDVEAAEVAMSAVAGEYSDAARPRLTTGPDGTLLVYRYTAPEIVGTGGQLVGEDARTEAVALPPKYDDRQGELSVRLDPSLAAGMRDGLTYLEHYPYECTEQVVSRFLPNVLTYQALRKLEIRDQELEARLPGLVEEGVNKLVLRQNGDGGWGWWYAGKSNPYLSAYVVFGLVRAQEAGFEVPARVLRSGLSYLESTLIGARNLQSYREANQQAFVIYVMAEAGETGRASERIEDLFDRRDKLSHYGRAFLAMTMGLIDEGDDRINTLLSDLQNEAILSATGAHWEEANYDQWAMNTDTRSTAVILDALAHLDADNELIPQVVRWLMVARQDGIWETTQETAWALIALTDWMVVTGELEGEYEYGAWLNGDVLAEGEVTPANVDESVYLRVGVAELLSEASNQLTIGRGPGEGRLYYTAHLKVYLPVEEIEPLDRGVIVQRRYVDPECTQGAKCPEVEQVQVGDVVQVRLTIIAPHDLYYVVVEDPLPAGAEAVDTSLDTTSLVAEEPGLYREAEEEVWYDFYTWWWRWYSHSEMRDEKVVLFADYLAAGTYEFVYTFRATLPGEYHVIPTTANEFYFPEVFGRADGRLFVIEEE
jgi:uncharacterized protein YfaS (alpha-2-macroglobulin family)